MTKNNKQRRKKSQINKIETNSPLFKINPQSRCFIETVMINIGLLSFLCGYSMVYFNAINFDDLYIIFGLNFQKPLAQGLLTGCIPASACVGALMSKVLLKKFTRKNCFYVLNLQCIISIGLIQSNVVTLIFIGRLLQGGFIGAGSAITPLYIKEFIPQMNGKYGLYHQLLLTVGIVFAFSLNLIFHQTIGDSKDYWRYHFGFPLIFAILQSATLYFKFDYETPRYLISEGRNDQARDLLNLIYKKEFVQQEFNVLFQAVNSKSQLMKYEQERVKQQSIGTQKSTEQIQKATSDIYQNQVTQQYNLEKSLISKKKQKKNNNLSVFCALHLSFQQQIIGIGAVIVYSGDIIKQVVPEISLYYSIIVHSFGLCCVILGVFLIKKIGRVTLMQVGGIIICICLIVTGINFLFYDQRIDMLIVVCVVFMRGIFSCTLGPIVWLYMTEIVKPNVVPYGTLINWFGATMVMVLFPIVKDRLGGPGWIFIFNAIVCGISIVINYFTLVETKDKNQLRIRKDFDKKLKSLKCIGNAKG